MTPALLRPCGKSPCFHCTGLAYAPLWCKQLSCHGDCHRGCWGPGELPASCYTSPSVLSWLHGRSLMCAFSSKQEKVIRHLGQGFKIDFKRHVSLSVYWCMCARSPHVSTDVRAYVPGEARRGIRYPFPYSVISLRRHLSLNLDFIVSELGWRPESSSNPPFSSYWGLWL